MEARIYEDGRLRVTQEPAEIEDAFARELPIWVELQQKDHACDVLLGQRLRLHPLTIEDIWATCSQPKLEDYERYVYLIFHGVSGTHAGELDLVELDLVLGPHYVITHDPHGLIDEARASIDRSPRLLQKGPAWVAHAILDAAVDRYLPLIDDLDTEIEQLGDEVLRKAGTRQGPPLLRKLLHFKRTLLGLRRMSVHQREILLRISRGEFQEIPAEAAPFYRDVYDHFLRANDLIESYRDLVTSALEVYLSVQSNRMNEIMKTLTVISTVMLPITFIAGLYGMNFKFMPELESPWGYPAVLCVMVVVVLGALLWFRHKGWIGSKQLDVPDDEDAA